MNYLIIVIGKRLFLKYSYDLKSVDLLNKIGIKAFKIASTDNNNFHCLNMLLQKKPLILSTGMSNLSEILETVRVLKTYNQKNFYFTMHIVISMQC